MATFWKESGDSFLLLCQISVFLLYGIAEEEKHCIRKGRNIVPFLLSPTKSARASTPSWWQQDDFTSHRHLVWTPTPPFLIINLSKYSLQQPIYRRLHQTSLCSFSKCSWNTRQSLGGGAIFSSLNVFFPPFLASVSLILSVSLTTHIVYMCSFTDRSLF